jgi:hypothetical protein
MNSLATTFQRTALGAFGRFTSPRLSILIFHRVLAQADPLFPAALDAAGFDSLMGYVAKAFKVLKLTDAIASL